ncbi:MAG: hypothetical protein IT324_01435 [Anaerolineae bacterium]|nr:hypothetical protein [Anaerolineae bacterium]
MITPSTPHEDLLYLSAQLNQRAFAQPPLEGWLDLFLETVRQRLPSIQGLQVVQTMGSAAMQIGKAGTLPPQAAPQYLLNESSPIAAVAAVIRAGKPMVDPTNRVYPIVAGKDTLGALLVFTEQADLDPVLEALSLQLGPAILINHPQNAQRMEAERLMNRLTTTMQGKNDLEQILAAALREIADALGAQQASVRIRASDSRIENLARKL